MTAAYAQQKMTSFTASCSDSSSARQAAFSFIMILMGIALAMSIIISVSVIVRIIISVLLILALLVILTKLKLNHPKG